MIGEINMKKKHFFTAILFLFLMIPCSCADTKGVVPNEGNEGINERLLLLEQGTAEQDRGYTYYLSRAYLLSMDEQYRAALDDLKKAVHEKEKASAYYMLGLLSVSVKEYEDAVYYAKKADELDGTGKHKLSLLELKGEAYFESGEYSSALSALEAAVGMGSTDMLTQMYYCTAKSIVEGKDFLSSRFDKKLEESRDDKKYNIYRMQYGELLLAVGNVDAAYELFSTASKDEPDILYWKLFLDYIHMLRKEKCSLEQLFLTFPVETCHKRIPNPFSKDECIAMLRFCLMYLYTNRALESEKACCAAYKCMSEYRDRLEPFADEQAVFEYMKNDLLFAELRNAYGF